MVKQKCGARGLRGIMEKCMLKVMYEVPSDESVRSVVINSEVVRGLEEPILQSEELETAS